jgi:hypothetical protein
VPSFIVGGLSVSIGAVEDPYVVERRHASGRRNHQSSGDKRQEEDRSSGRSSHYCLKKYVVSITGDVARDSDCYVSRVAQ